MKENVLVSPTEVMIHTERLQEIFLADAKIIDSLTLYIVAKKFNLVIDPEVNSLAVACWAAYMASFPEMGREVIVGIPDSGIRWAGALATETQLATLPTKKGEIIPGSWQGVVSYQAGSFTGKGQQITSHIGFVESGMDMFLTEDVVARGETAIKCIEALQAAGVNVKALLTLFAKAPSRGVELIKSRTGVDTYPLITVNSVSADNKIELAPITPMTYHD